MTDSPLHHRRFDRRDVILLVVLLVLLALVGLLRLTVGEPVPILESGSIDFSRFSDILLLRAHRLIVGIAVGASLGVAGTLLQALLRNPLASPYILGVSSGAAVGVVASLSLSSVAFLSSITSQSAAALGALLTLILIFALSQKRGHIDPLGLLLVGVIANAINGAVIMFIVYLDPLGLGVDINRWLLGYLDSNLPWSTVIFLASLIAAVTALAAFLGRSIDIATFSDAEAQTLGLNLHRLRLSLFILSGILTAASVSMAGPIGFVGLICPHFIRLIIGPRHTPLILGSALAGAVLVVAADASVKLLDLGQGLMPIGVLMVILGGPAFLWMLRGQIGRGAEV